MPERETPQEINPREIILQINEEMHNLPPETLDAMVSDFVSGQENPNSTETLEQLLREGDPKEKLSIQIMAVIEHSPLRDLCIQYTKEGKFSGKQFGLHGIGNIMTSYLLFKKKKK